MPNEYHTKNHCKYLIKIHLILVCKYRKRLLFGKVGVDCKQIIFDISQKSNFKIDTMESEQDHIHLLLDIEPSISVSSIVNRLKSVTTNQLWKRHGEFLRKHFWKEQTFFSDGYFVCSVGDASTDTIRNYIRTQG